MIEMGRSFQLVLTILGRSCHFLLTILKCVDGGDRDTIMSYNSYINYLGLSPKIEESAPDLCQFNRENDVSEHQI